MIMIVSSYNLKGYKIPAASKDSKKAYENQEYRRSLIINSSVDLSTKGDI